MTFKKILIAVDESPISLQAATVGLNLAAEIDASIAFIYVVDTTGLGAGEAGIPAADFIASLEREAQESLNRVMLALSGHKDHLRFIPNGKPGSEILKAAQEWSADLIVLGSHGRTGVSRLLMGSTAEHVLRHSLCPVLVVPREKTDN